MSDQLQHMLAALDLEEVGPDTYRAPHVEAGRGVVRFSSDEWLLIDHESVHAGNGRVFGRADVFTENGRLVASFSQDALVRVWPEGQSPLGREGTAF